MADLQHTRTESLQPTTTHQLTFDREHWRTVRFGEFAENVTDRVDKPAEAGVSRYVGLEHLDPKSLRIQHWGLPTDVEATKLRFQPGDIIFGRRRAYQRKLAVADFEGICSAHALVLRARADIVLPEFLPFFMRSDAFFERALAISVGSLSPTINWKTLAQQEFALPPKDAQRRIAEILWAADDSYFITSAVLDKISELKDVVSSICFDNTASNRGDNQNQLLSLSECLSFASDGPFGSNLKTEHYQEAGARVIRLQNIGAGFFDDSDQAYISLDYFRQLKRYALNPGDIVIAGLGDETHKVGRACEIPADLGPAINKADCFCLRANTDVVEQAYLLYFLNSPNARKQIIRISQGTTRSRINVSNLKTIKISLPSLNEQRHVIARFRSLEMAQSIQESHLLVKSQLCRALREHLIGNAR